MVDFDYRDVSTGHSWGVTHGIVRHACDRCGQRIKGGFSTSACTFATSGPVRLRFCTIKARNCVAGSEEPLRYVTTHGA